MTATRRRQRHRARRRRRRGPVPARAASPPSTPSSVTAVVNTGDDTELHGLAISPDLDTIVYTLAGAIDPERGWGLAGETWQAMAALERYADGPPDGLGGGDRRGSASATATSRPTSTARPGSPRAPRRPRSPPRSRAAWGVGITLLPMTDGRFRTMIVLADRGEEVVVPGLLRAAAARRRRSRRSRFEQRRVRRSTPAARSRHRDGPAWS